MTFVFDDGIFDFWSADVRLGLDTTATVVFRARVTVDALKMRHEFWCVGVGAASDAEVCAWFREHGKDYAAFVPHGDYMFCL